jgi:hypothetical protein
VAVGVGWADVDGSGDSPGPSWGIVVIEAVGRGQSRRAAASPRRRLAGFAHSPGSGPPGSGSPGSPAVGDREVSSRFGAGVTTATVAAVRVRVTYTVGVRPEGRATAGVATAGTVLGVPARPGGGGPPVRVAGGRRVESALDCGTTAGGGATDPPSTSCPEPDAAAMTVTAAIETVARAAKVACDS